MPVTPTLRDWGSRITNLKPVWATQQDFTSKQDHVYKPKGKKSRRIYTCYNMGDIWKLCIKWKQPDVKNYTLWLYLCKMSRLGILHKGLFSGIWSLSQFFKVQWYFIHKISNLIFILSTFFSFLCWIKHRPCARLSKYLAQLWDTILLVQKKHLHTTLKLT